jgi:hypothetical protein
MRSRSDDGRTCVDHRENGAALRTTAERSLIYKIDRGGVRDEGDSGRHPVTNTIQRDERPT